MILRAYLRLLTALRSERGSIQDWLPAGMAIVAAVVVLVVVMNYFSGNAQSWLNQIWQSIVGHL